MRWDAGNPVLSKEFWAGLLLITGANSAARYLFPDKIDA
jgi:hypothetical protein